MDETVRGELVKTDVVFAIGFFEAGLTTFFCLTSLEGLEGLLRILVGAKVFLLLFDE